MIGYFLQAGSDEGYYVLLVVFGLFGIGFIYIAIDKGNKRAQIRYNIKSGRVTWSDYYTAKKIEDEELMYEVEKILKEKERQANLDELKKLEKNKQVYESDIRLRNKFCKIENQIHHCNKCSNNKYRIWNLTNSILDIRCDDCKKRFEYYNEDLKDIELKEVLKDIELLKERDSFEESNELVKESIIEYNTEGKRSNLPSTYHFTLYSALEPIIVRGKRNKILPEDKRSRRIPQDVKDAVWRRDEGKCVECGSNEDLEFDHIIPHSRGGANTYRNIQLLCEKCNRQKSAKIG